MSSQPCYDRGRAQIYSKALTGELSIFANVWDEIRWFWRKRSLLTMKFVWRFYWVLKPKVYLAKMSNPPKHHGAGPQRRGAQCSCIGCIVLRPALRVTRSKNCFLSNVRNLHASLLEKKSFSVLILYNPRFRYPVQEIRPCHCLGGQGCNRARATGQFPPNTSKPWC